MVGVQIEVLMSRSLRLDGQQQHVASLPIMTHPVYGGVAFALPDQVGPSTLVKLQPGASPGRNLLDVTDQGAMAHVLDVRMEVPAKPAHLVPLQRQIRAADDHSRILQLLPLPVPFLEYSVQQVGRVPTVRLLGLWLLRHTTDLRTVLDGWTTA